MVTTDFECEEAQSKEWPPGGDGDDYSSANPSRPRTAYRRCHPITLYTLPARHWILILSTVFLLLPGSNDLLYIDHDSFGRRLLGNSCTTTNEWTWIGLLSALLIVPHVKNAPRVRQWTPRLIIWRPKISWVQLNCLW